MTSEVGMLKERSTFSGLAAAKLLLSLVALGAGVAAASTAAHGQPDSLDQAKSNSTEFCQSAFRNHPPELEACLHPPTPTAPQSDAEWASSTLKPLGWRVFAAGDGIYVYVRDKMTVPTHRMWVRWEYRQAGKSVVALTEYDCKERRERVLQATGYAGSNLTNPTPADARIKAWNYEQPGSLGETLLHFACTKPTELDKFLAGH